MSVVPIRNVPVWRRESFGMGAAIAIHPTDAHFLLQRGWVKINGKRAQVSLDQGEPKTGLVALRLDFEQ